MPALYVKQNVLFVQLDSSCIIHSSIYYSKIKHMQYDINV